MIDKAHDENLQRKLLWRYTANIRWRLIVLGIVSGVSVASSLAFPYFVGQGINQAIANKSFVGLGHVVATLFGIFAVQAIAVFIQYYFSSYISETVVNRLRQELFQKLLSLDMTFFRRHHSGELASRISSDTSKIQVIFTQLLPGFISTTLGLIGAAVIMARLSYTLTFFIMLAAPAIGAITIVIGKAMKRISTQSQDILAKNIASVTETIKNISVVKAFTAEDFETKQYSQSLNTLWNAMLKGGVYRGVSMALNNFLGWGFITCIAGVTGEQAIYGLLNAGLIITFLLYGNQISQNFVQLSYLYGLYKEASGSTQRVFELLQEQSHLNEPIMPVCLMGRDRTLAMAHVSFCYEDQEVLHDISLEIYPGEVVAMVGPSGAGKTTIFELLQRFYDPDHGIVTLNGIDVRQVGSKQLRAQIAVVSQQSPLFSGTIKENIAYGRPEATQEEIEYAARAALAHDFIMALPDGYATVLGESGVGLSGGERQRLTIARAIVKNAPILLLDEATNALDNTSERYVQQAIEKLRHTHSIFIIAHRVNTVQFADRIFVLDNGSIIESGFHDELLRKKGLYAELYGRQQLDERDSV